MISSALLFFFVMLQSNIKSQGGIVYEIEQPENMDSGHDPGALSSGSNASLCKYD